MLAISFGLFCSDASWCPLLLWIPQGHLHIAQVPQGEQVQITQDSEVSQVSCHGHRPYSHALSVWKQCHSSRAWETLWERLCLGRWGDWDTFLVSLADDDGVK